MITLIYKQIIAMAGYYACGAFILDISRGSQMFKFWDKYSKGFKMPEYLELTW